MGLRNRTLLSEERCFFITTSCYQHLPLLFDETCFETLLDNFRFYNQKYTARLIAYVLINNHIHFIIYFDGENRLIDYMRDFKKYTALTIRQHIERERPDLRPGITYPHRSQQFKIWADRYDDVYLYSRDVCEIKIDYIHQNTVKAGLVTDPVNYRFSSAAFYLSASKPSDLLHYRDLF